MGSSAVRTTLHLDHDVYRAARSLAAARGEGLGAVVSELARKGLAAPVSGGRKRRGFPVFEVLPDAPPLTREMVRAALEDE
ncbi:MAG TPA: antitoxin [Polyangia bacterium]|jgi:hypothetical protein|nr:antitoxin [Polyangia bacterium]